MSKNVRLVSYVVLAVLAAACIYGKCRRFWDVLQFAHCQENLYTLYADIERFRGSMGRYPNDLRELASVCGVAKWYFCPTDTYDLGSNDPSIVEASNYALIVRPTTGGASARGLVLVYEKTRRHKRGRNACLVNGAVGCFRDKAMARLLARSGVLGTPITVFVKGPLPLSLGASAP